jgi:hypothetical protein
MGLVVIAKKAENVEISVRIRVEESTPFKIKSELTANCMKNLINATDESQYESYAAIEATCFSGLGYASGLLNRPNVKATVEFVSGCFKHEGEDLDGFAIATTVAMLAEMGRTNMITQDLLAGWEIVSLDI